ncbi:uncharacterized protein BYT42DRAFT_574518 [Radiomyces spectabilis]|uniref:uncharacterized protein n=1 Tax=Radiomyces spectabilis TaxID=64574 RepID=UPI00221E5AF6|nr:uncharacterized protein BYT42DRAFT_574518 [Radiomyces spectabilis]KAI8376417.1 hypothetical protein BYT42DRAFT_574518 [Radiomyces spectabilis]
MATATSDIAKSIDELTHAIAGIAHVERPCLETRLILRKMHKDKEPLTKELAETEAKVAVWKAEIKNLDSWSLQWFLLLITCEIRAERDRARKGLQKAEELVLEARDKVENMNDQIKDVETPNEKNEVDYRTLQKYREDLTTLLDNLAIDETFLENRKQEIQTIKDSLNQIIEDDKTLEKVRELLKAADSAILEAIVELRQSNHESNLGEGRVYFPETAYEAIKEARELYPKLPAIQPPEKYVNEADNTGAYYSPMQRYLWDIRRKLDELLAWCDHQVILHMEVESRDTIVLGEKTDQWNMERRRLAKEQSLM